MLSFFRGWVHHNFVSHWVWVTTFSVAQFWFLRFYSKNQSVLYTLMRKDMWWRRVQISAVIWRRVYMCRADSLHSGSCMKNSRGTFCIVWEERFLSGGMWCVQGTVRVLRSQISSGDCELYCVFDLSTRAAIFRRSNRGTVCVGSCVG